MHFTWAGCNEHRERRQVGVSPTYGTAATYLLRPGEHDGNEPEILAAVLDELILELRGTKGRKERKSQVDTTI